jgi:tripartite-type tricarboxylate transporter receptor subunit TctC
MRKFPTLLLACGAALLIAAEAHAQDWPQRPLRIMVIAAPGGLPDAMARLVAKQGLEASTMSPEQLGAYIKAESAKWASVLENAKVRKL